MEDITVNEIGYDKDTTKDHNDNDTSPGELWLQLCLIVYLLQIRAWCRLLSLFQNNLLVCVNSTLV